MSLILSALLAAPVVFAQNTVLQTGDTVGTVRVGATCPQGSTSCLTFQNDAGGGYPMEIVKVTYMSREGLVLYESPPVIEGRLQCVQTRERLCVPVLMPGQTAAMQLPAPPAPGELIVVTMRTWDTPGSEAWLNPTPRMIAPGFEATLVGDPVATTQAPASPSETRCAKVGKSSFYVNYGKGTMCD